MEMNQLLYITNLIESQTTFLYFTSGIMFMVIVAMLMYLMDKIDNLSEKLKDK